MKIRGGAENFQTLDNMGPLIIDPTNNTVDVKIPVVEGATHYRAEIWNTANGLWLVTPTVAAAAEVDGYIPTRYEGLTPGTPTYSAEGVAADYDLTADTPGE